MFKKFVFAATGSALFFGAALPTAATAHEYRTVVNTIQVTISCFRGPWEEVIIDRPQPGFIDSLVAVGYTFPEAHAIAERVCRDPAGVNNPDAMIATMNRILAESPPGR